jgi:hypothetical protein
LGKRIQKKFNIMPIKTADEDLKEILFRERLNSSNLPPNQKIRVITILHQFRDKAARDREGRTKLIYRGVLAGLGGIPLEAGPSCHHLVFS